MLGVRKSRRGNGGRLPVSESIPSASKLFSQKLTREGIGGGVVESAGEKGRRTEGFGSDSHCRRASRDDGGGPHREKGQEKEAVWRGAQE